MEKDVISADKVLVCWSGLVNCQQRMIMGRNAEAGEETCLCRVGGKMRVPLAVRLKSLPLCWFPILDAPRRAVWVCSLK